MEIKKGRKYRLYPTKEQEVSILHNIDGAKVVYNTALYEKNKEYNTKLISKIAALGIAVGEEDIERLMADKKGELQGEYKSILIEKTCKKFGVEPVYKRNKKTEEEYMDNTATKHLLYDTIYERNGWAFPLNTKGKHDYSAMSTACTREGYDFDFNISVKSKPLTYFTKEHERASYFKSLDSNAVNGALRDLETAYKNFYSGTAQYPQYKKRNNKDPKTHRPNPLNIIGGYHTAGTNKNQFNFLPFTDKNGNINDKFEYVRIPKVGFVKMRKHRPFPNDSLIGRYAVISRDTSGAYFISFIVTTDEDLHYAALSCKKIIGYEFSIGRRRIISSTGTEYKPITGYEALEEKRRYLEKQLEYMKKGSQNYFKKQYRIQRLYNRITRIKEGQIDLIAEDIVKNADYICLRDTDVKELMHKPVEIDDIKLKAEGKPVPEISAQDAKNCKKYYRSDREDSCKDIADQVEFLAKARRAFQDQAWSKTIEKIEEKAARDGKRVLKTSEFYLSTQKCSHCGAIDENMGGIKNIFKKTYECPVCGHIADREINSANNIKQDCIGMM